MKQGATRIADPADNRRNRHRGLRSPAVLEPEEGGGFFVRFVDRENTDTAGLTLDEALFNACRSPLRPVGMALGSPPAHSRPVPRWRRDVSHRPGGPNPSGLADSPGAGESVLGGTGPLAGHLLTSRPSGLKSPPFAGAAPTGKGGGSPGQTRGAGLGVIRHSDLIPSNSMELKGWDSTRLKSPWPRPFSRQRIVRAGRPNGSVPRSVRSATPGIRLELAKNPMIRSDLK